MTIYSAADAAQPGYMPVEQLTEKVRLRYEEQQLGIRRYYMGRQNQIRIDRVIRVQKAGNITTQDVAITEDGTQYRIDLVQSVQNVYPPSVDLTLYDARQTEETK